MNTKTFTHTQDFTAIKKAGFSVSADDLAKTQFELTEEELEGVAGGSGTEAARLAMDDHLKRRKLYCALRTPAQ